MKRFKIISILLTMIVIGLVTYTLVSSTVQSVESSFSITNLPGENIQASLSQATETEGQATNLDVLSEVDLPTDIESMSNASIEYVLNELTRLEQINLEFLSRPGWLHTTQKTWNADLVNRQEDKDAPYSTAGMFPPTQIFDSWERIIDHEGTYGYGGFIVNSDENGNPVQIVVSDANGNGGNLTLLDRGLTEFFEDDPDASVEFSTPIQVTSGIKTIIEWFENAQDYNLNPDVKAGYILNNEVEEYQIRIETVVIGEPYEFEWLSESVGGFVSFYRIDPVTGNILELTEDAIGLSGKTYPMFSQITLVREIVDVMPEDVQRRYKAALDQYMNLISQGE